MPPNPDGGFTHKTKSGMWAPGCWAVLGVLLGQRAEFRAMLLLPSTAAAHLGPWGGLLRGAVCGGGRWAGPHHGVRLPSLGEPGWRRWASRSRICVCRASFLMTFVQSGMPPRLPAPIFLPGETFLATGQGLVSPLLRKWSLNSGDTKVIGVSRTEYQRGESCL